MTNAGETTKVVDLGPEMGGITPGISWGTGMTKSPPMRRGGQAFLPMAGVSAVGGVPMPWPDQRQARQRLRASTSSLDRRDIN
ncbi:MAG: hypothetical protein H6R00_4430 [Proteobacteria bacterium]|nr:hypothetical protein [Pseudomonadota bacterium]